MQNADGYWENMPAAGANSAYVYSQSSPEDSQATKVNGSTAEGKVQSPEKKLAEQSTSESGKKIQDPMPEDEDD